MVNRTAQFFLDSGVTQLKVLVLSGPGDPGESAADYKSETTTSASSLATYGATGVGALYAVGGLLLAAVFATDLANSPVIELARRQPYNRKCESPVGYLGRILVRAARAS